MTIHAIRPFFYENEDEDYKYSYGGTGITIKHSDNMYLFVVLGHTMSTHHKIEQIRIPINDQEKHAFNIIEIYRPRQDISEENELEYAIKEVNILYMTPHGTSNIPAITVDQIYSWGFSDWTFRNGYAVGVPIPRAIGEIDYENKRLSVKKVVVEGAVNLDKYKYTQFLIGGTITSLPSQKKGLFEYQEIFNGICGGAVFSVINGEEKLVGIIKSAGSNKIGFYISSILLSILKQDTVWEFR